MHFCKEIKTTISWQIEGVTIFCNYAVYYMQWDYRSQTSLLTTRMTKHTCNQDPQDNTAT